MGMYLHISRAKSRMKEWLKTIEVDDFLWYEVWKISKRKLLVEKQKTKKKK